MTRKLLAALVAIALLPALSAAKKEAKEPPQESHDGLQLLPDRKVALVYVKPEADLSDYSKVMILDTYVAFKKGWERGQRATSVYKVTPHDMKRIKEATAELFHEVFVEKLSENDGYPVVDTADSDVLLLRPAIIDLEVTAPDTQAARSYNFASTAGAATLYLELFDSVSGEILARAMDRKSANYPGQLMRYSNRVTNQAAARKILAGWAGLLRERLDELHATPLAGDAAAGAVADLAERLGVEPASIEVRGVEQVEWPDSSLGCPKPGMMYSQVMTAGSKIELAAEGKTFAYHAAPGREPFLCER